MESPHALNAQNPIHETPPEVMTHIFSYFDPSIVLPLSHNPPSAQVAISQVCEKWRTVIHHMAPLWSHFVIELPVEWQGGVCARNQTFLAESFTTWLQCSASKPFTLTLGHVPQTLFSAIIHPVRQHANLFRLVLRTDLEHSLEDFRDQLPLLGERRVVRSLSLRIEEGAMLNMNGVWRPNVHPPGRFNSRPFDLGCWENLRALYWDCSFASFPLPTATDAMRNIRTLSLSGPTKIFDSISIIRSLHNLTYLSLAHLVVNSETQHSFRHSGIKVLEITCQNDPYVYLPWLTLPSITKLVLTKSPTTDTSTSTETAYVELDNFNERSSCIVGSLHIRFNSPSQDIFTLKKSKSV